MLRERHRLHVQGMLQALTSLGEPFHARQPVGRGDIRVRTHRTGASSHRVGHQAVRPLPHRTPLAAEQLRVLLGQFGDRTGWFARHPLTTPCRLVRVNVRVHEGRQGDAAVTVDHVGPRRSRTLTDPAVDHDQIHGLAHPEGPHITEDHVLSGLVPASARADVDAVDGSAAEVRNIMCENSLGSSECSGVRAGGPVGRRGPAS